MGKRASVTSGSRQSEMFMVRVRERSAVACVQGYSTDEKYRMLDAG